MRSQQTPQGILKNTMIFSQLPLKPPAAQQSVGAIRTVEDGIWAKVQPLGLNPSRDAGQGCHILLMSPSPFHQTGDDGQTPSSHSSLGLSTSLTGVSLPPLPTSGPYLAPCMRWFLYPSPPAHGGEAIETTHGEGSGTL